MARVRSRLAQLRRAAHRALLGFLYGGCVRAPIFGSQRIRSHDGDQTVVLLLKYCYYIVEGLTVYEEKGLGMADSATIAEQTVARPGVPDRAERDDDWSSEPVKITMSLPQGCVENIKWLAKRLHAPNSHVVRRAIDLRYRIQKEIDAGAKILIERDGKLMTIWFD